MNIGNPREMTIEEIAATIIQHDRREEQDRLQAPADRRSRKSASARYHAGPDAAELGAEGAPWKKGSSKRSNTSRTKVR